jgi:hypothetical protein
VLAGGGPEEKIADGPFRGDLFLQPNGTATWMASISGSGSIRLLDLDVERRTLLWNNKVPGGTLLASLPMFSPNGKLISAAVQESRDHDAIWVFETATGKSRLAVRLPFHMTFRADWVDNGKAFIVNRQDSISHVVLFDHFWVNDHAQAR